MKGRSLDLDIDSGGQRQTIEGINRFACGLHDVDQSLVCSDLELLARLLVDVRASQNRVTFNPCWQGDWPPNVRACALGRIDDFRRRLVEHRVIVSFHPDANTLLTHSGHRSFFAA